MTQAPAFVSRLRPLSILALERMSPAQLQHREKLEADERRQWLEAQRGRLPAREGER
jgi:hypothetical protein